MLLRRFLDGAHDHVGPILTNVTRTPEGRRLLCDAGGGGLGAAAAALRAPAASDLRRRGCAAALRNCCLSAAESEDLEGVLAQKGALKDILAALCGDDSPGATGDPDATVRQHLAEAIVMLAASDEGRGALWDAGAPEALRRAYADEEDADVCAALEEAARLFLEGAGGVEVAEEGGEGAAQVGGGV